MKIVIPSGNLTGNALSVPFGALDVTIKRLRTPEGIAQSPRGVPREINFSPFVDRLLERRTLGDVHYTT